MRLSAPLLVVLVGSLGGCAEAPPADTAPLVTPAPDAPDAPDGASGADAPGRAPPTANLAAPPSADPPPAVGAGPPPRAATAADLRDPSLPDGAPRRVAARHLLVAYKGAVGADPALRRSRAEARARAETLKQQIAAGAEFAAVATAESDDASKERGGHLGAFGPGVMHPDFEEALFRLAPGAISGVVETPFGFHLIERLPLQEVRLSQLVVQWDGAHRSTTTRTRADAEARLIEAQTRLHAGEPFAAVAAALSDGASAPRGGDLGWFQRDQMVPQLEAAAFSLAPGETSGVVESPSGLHLLHRVQ